MKFWYVVVMEKYKCVLQKQCMSAKEANTLLIEMKEKYPKPRYIVTKEQF